MTEKIYFEPYNENDEFWSNVALEDIVDLINEMHESDFDISAKVDYEKEKIIFIAYDSFADGDIDIATLNKRIELETTLDNYFGGYYLPEVCGNSVDNWYINDEEIDIKAVVDFILDSICESFHVATEVSLDIWMNITKCLKNNFDTKYRKEEIINILKYFLKNNE